MKLLRGFLISFISMSVMAMEDPHETLNNYEESVQRSGQFQNTYSLQEFEQNNYAGFSLGIFDRVREVLINPVSAPQKICLSFKTLMLLSYKHPFPPAQYFLGVIAEQASDMQRAQMLYTQAAYGNFNPAHYGMSVFQCYKLANQQSAAQGNFHNPAQGLSQKWQNAHMQPYDPLFKIWMHPVHKQHLVNCYFAALCEEKEAAKAKAAQKESLKTKSQHIPVLDKQALGFCEAFEKHLIQMKKKIDFKTIKEVLDSEEYAAIEALSDTASYPAYLIGVFWVRVHRAEFSAKQLKQLKTTSEEIKERAIVSFIQAVENNPYGLTDAFISSLSEEYEKHEGILAQVLHALSKDEKKKKQIFQVLKDYVCGHRGHWKWYGPVTYDQIGENFTKNYVIFELLLEHEALLLPFDMILHGKDTKHMGWEQLLLCLKDCFKPDQNFVFGKLLFAKGYKNEGAEFIRYAAAKNKQALWCYIRLLLKEKELQDIEEALKLMEREIECKIDAACFDTVRLVIEELEGLAQSSNKIADFLVQTFERGIDTVITPHEEKMFKYQILAAGVHHPRAFIARAQRLMLDKANEDWFQHAWCNLKQVFTKFNDDQFKKEASWLIGALGESVPLRDQYDLVLKILFVNKELALQEFIKIESKLWANKKKIESEHAQLLVTSGAYDVLKNLAEEDGRVAYYLAVALSFRCIKGVGLDENAFDLEAACKNILSLFDLAEENNFDDFNGNNANTQGYRQKIGRMLASHYSSIGDFETAGRYLKPLVHCGDKEAMTFYGEFCLKGLIQLTGINTAEYGHQLLEKVLAADNVPAKIYSRAQNALIVFYADCLNEQLGASSITQTRENYLKLAPLLGARGAGLADKITAGTEYYSFDEIMSLYQHDADNGDPVAQRELGIAHYRVGNIKEAEKYLKLAADAGVPNAHLELAVKIDENEIDGTTEDIINHINAFMQAALISCDSMEKVKNYISTARAILINLGDNGSYKAYYNLIPHDLKLYELTKDKIYADCTARTLTAAELMLVKLTLRAEENEQIKQAISESDYELITSLGIIEHAEKLAHENELPSLAFAIGAVHKGRFVNCKHFLESGLEHIARAQMFFEIAAKNNKNKKEERAVSMHLAELYQYAAQVNISHYKIIEARKCFEKSLRYNAKNPVTLYRYGKLLIERYEELNWTDGKAKALGVIKLKEAIAAGSKEAQMFLAHHYMYAGDYGKKEAQEAIKLMEILAEEDEPAKVTLATWLLEARGGSFELEKAKSYLLSLGETEDKLAEFTLGVCYYTRGIREKNNAHFKDAAMTFEAIKDHPKVGCIAHLYLSKLKLSGLLGQKSIDKALEHFEKFLECGEFILNAEKYVQTLQIIQDLLYYHADLQVKYLLGKYWRLCAAVTNDHDQKTLALTQLKKMVELFENDPALAEKCATIYAYIADLYASYAVNLQQDVESSKAYASQAISNLYRALKNNCDENKICMFSEVQNIAREIIDRFGFLALSRPEIAPHVSKLMEIILNIWCIGT